MKDYPIKGLFSGRLELADKGENDMTAFMEPSVMFGMANLPPKRTGLKYQIWYSAMIEEQKPRIRVDLRDGKALSVQIEDHKVIGAVDKISSKDLNDILKWIDLNKDLLLNYWNDAHTGTIDNGDVIDNVKKLE